jgi:hypothetical protein
MNGGDDLQDNCVTEGRLLLLILLIIAVSATQCAPLSHKQEWVPNRPETKVLPAKPEVVKEAMERVFVKKRYSLDTEKSNSMHLQTEWLEEGKYRNMVKADLKPFSRSKTEVTLHVLIEEKKLFKEEWEPIDEVGEDTYRILMGEVEMECYRVLYDGA